jgi:hypothetical protein
MFTENRNIFTYFVCEISFSNQKSQILCWFIKINKKFAQKNGELTTLHFLFVSTYDMNKVKYSGFFIIKNEILLIKNAKMSRSSLMKIQFKDPVSVYSNKSTRNNKNKLLTKLIKNKFLTKSSKNQTRKIKTNFYKIRQKNQKQTPLQAP